MFLNETNGVSKYLCNQAVQQAGQVVNSETFLRITVTYHSNAYYIICCFVQDCFNFPGRPGEKLLLQYGTMDGHPTWMAYEGMWNEEAGQFEVRQEVFRTRDTTVLTDGGYHSWQMNGNASKEGAVGWPTAKLAGGVGLHH